MTKVGDQPMGRGSSESEARCAWCRHPLPPRAGRGRPRKYCSGRCRQWDWVARQRARELQLADDELVMTRRELDAWRDDVYVLACAVDDAERDLDQLGPDASVAELREVLDAVLAGARPLRDRDTAWATATAAARRLSS